MVKCLYLCFHAVIFTFSDRRSLKIENENNRAKTITTEAPYRGPESQEINIETYHGWFELPLTGTNFHGPKPVRATEVIQYLRVHIRIDKATVYSSVVSFSNADVTCKLN